MSTAAALARAEADRVEREDPEPEPEPEPTPAPEPEPEPQAVGEKELRALERENDRHATALGKLLGEDFATFQPCPCCDGGPAGFVPPFEVFPDEVAAAKGQAVYAYFEGRAEIEPPYVVAKTMQMCPDCDGWGQVITGAKNAMHRLEQCPTCNGNGYTPRNEVVIPPHAWTPPNTVVPGEIPQPGQPEAVVLDSWGRQMGHPHFGLHPATIGA